MNPKIKEYVELLHGKELTFELSLLDTLYNSTQGLNRVTLVEQLHIERRTFYKLIEHLNTFALKQLKKEVIHIDSKNNYQFIGEKEDFYRLKVALLETSPAVLLAKQFMTTSEISLEEFCTTHYLGEATVRRKIRTANRFLTRFNIQLKIRKQYIHLTGDELAIRHGMISFFWMTYHGIKWPFTSLSRESLKDKMAPFFSLAPALNQSKQEQLLYVLAVTFSRVHLKKAIFEWGLPLHFEGLLIENSLYTSFKNRCEKVFPLPPQEVKFLFLFLLTFPDTYLYGNPFQILQRLKLSSYPLYDNLFVYAQWIQVKHPEWELERETNKKFLAVLLSGLINIDLFHGRSMSLDNAAFQEHWGKEFPHLIPTIQTFVKESSDTTLAPSQQHLLTLLYARAYIILFPPHDFEPPISLLLKTDLPIYAEEYIRHTLYHTLYTKFNIKILSPGEESVAPDLILSTNLMENKDALLITPEVTNKDILAISEACASLKKSKEKEHKDKEKST